MEKNKTEYSKRSETFVTVVHDPIVSSREISNSK